MSKVRTKHFQYTGVDDFDRAVDSQINEYIKNKNINPDNLVDIKYAAHSSQGVNTYSALVIYIED